MIDDGMVGTVEDRRQLRFGDCHSNRVPEALSERACRGFDTRSVAVFGVAGRSALPLTKLLDIVEREIVSREIKHAVQQHRRVSSRQNETIAVNPGGIPGVVPQMPGPEHVCERGERHRCAWMAGVCFLHGIHRENADRVYAELIEILFVTHNWRMKSD